MKRALTAGYVIALAWLATICDELALKLSAAAERLDDARADLQER